MKALLKKWLGPRNLGRIDYYFKPRLRESWGGPLNGQRFRREIYRQITSAFTFDGILETGTYRGTTTALFSQLGVPVYSVESNPRYFSFATCKFRQQRDKVHLFEGDSVRFLGELSQKPQIAKSRLFFYLDAHWYDHLPLLEELRIVFQFWSEPVVMIDDFCVPGTAYGYDDYGAGAALTLNYLSPLYELGIATFFPSAGPEQETGLKRGCIVLCRQGEPAHHMAELDSLKAGPRIQPEVLS
jgi:hypothetical protein